MTAPGPGLLSLVPFVSVDHMMRIVWTIGVERMLVELAAYIEEDFRRWELFDKTPRVAAHSAEGVIELMPTSDGAAGRRRRLRLRGSDLPTDGPQEGGHLAGDCASC